MLHQKTLVGVSLDAADDQHEEHLSTDSQQAVNRALELAERHGGRVTFAHTFAVSNRVREFFGENPESLDAFRSARTVMTDLVDQASARGIEAEWLFLYGKPSEEISKYAKESNTDLIIVGTRQQRGVKRTLLGSTAQRVMMEAPCPVLIENCEKFEPYKTILIATDNSNRGALRHGLAHGRKSDSSVHVLHGVENWYEDRWHRAGLVRHIVEREHEEALSAAHGELSERVEAVAADLGTDAPDVRIASGRPDAVIWDAIEELKPDLVVLGYTGRTGLSGFFVGDTARRILPDLPCSLLTVPSIPAVPTR